MDEVDISQARMEKEAELRAAARQKAAANKSRADECVECGEEIPLQRQNATGGTDICITCAEIAETKRKHYR